MRSFVFMVFLQIHDVILDDWSFFIFGNLSPSRTGVLVANAERCTPADLRYGAMHAHWPELTLAQRCKIVEAGNLDQEYPPVPVQE